jgi:hypothetical protein
MVKTTVYLDDDVVRSLLDRQSKPQAELIREALSNFTAGESSPLPAGMGMFNSGHTDTTAKRKELLKSAARTGT